MKLGLVLADDEPPARQMIREYLELYEDVEVVAECGNGNQAVESINTLSPHIAVLDVRMPGLNGFEVLERLERLPQIIFSTAYDQFALRAFEVSATDYLLKPYTQERFDIAMQKAITSAKAGAVEAENLAALLQHVQAPAEAAFPEVLFVRSGARIVPVRQADINWIEAAGDYTRMHTPAGTHLCHLGMRELEEKLDPGRFARIHRSTIVALGAIQHLRSDGEGGYRLTLKDNTQLRVSRTYAATVRTRLF